MNQRSSASCFPPDRRTFLKNSALLAASLGLVDLAGAADALIKRQYREGWEFPVMAG